MQHSTEPKDRLYVKGYGFCKSLRRPRSLSTKVNRPFYDLSWLMFVSKLFEMLIFIPYMKHYSKMS